MKVADESTFKVLLIFAFPLTSKKYVGLEVLIPTLEVRYIASPDTVFVQKSFIVISAIAELPGFTVALTKSYKVPPEFVMKFIILNDCPTPIKTPSFSIKIPS